MNEQERTKKANRIVFHIVSLGFLISFFVFWFNEYWWNGFMEFDSYTNSTVGYQITEGHSLYRGVWGSKPPGIYFADAIFLYLFGVTHTSISIAQIVSGVFLLAGTYMLSFRISKDIFLSLSTSVLLMCTLYFSVLYQGGNLTEEYGIVWVVWGWLFILLYDQTDSNPYLWLGGFSFCMSLWFKEPFLFSIIPVTLYMIYLTIRRRNFKIILQYFLGAMVPNAALLLYFWSSNTWFDYIKYLYYTTSYSGYTALSIIDKWQLALDHTTTYLGDHYAWWPLLILLIIPGWMLGNQTHRKWIGLFGLTLIFEFHSTSLSGYGFQHYFIQLVPSFFVLVVLGGTGVLHGMQQKISPTIARFVVRIVFVGLCVVAINRVWAHFEPPKGESSRVFTTETMDLLNQLKSDTSSLYVDDPMYSHYYVDSKISSTAFMPVGVYHFYVVEDRYSYERIERHVASLHASPPEFILTSSRSGILDKHEKLIDWFSKNYKLVNEEYFKDEHLKLWRHQEFVPATF